MLQNEKVSVIVPVYNVEKYLTRCIESIICQTYNNLEIILVDDGSTDKSGMLCEDYAKKDGRIRVIHKKNGGLSDARNIGIESSSGEYLVFVDSDDYLHTEFIDKLYNTLKLNNADLSICNFTKVYADKEVCDDGILFDEVITGNQAIQKLIEKNNIYLIVAWNKLYKRQLFDNLRYPAGRINEDEFVVHRILGQCSKIACLKSSMYYYFQRSDSIMGKINKGDINFLLNITDFLFDRMLYIKSIQMDNYASKVYRDIINIYSTLSVNKYEKNQNTEIRRQINQLKKSLQENSCLLNHMGLKQKIKFKLILRSKIFNMYYSHRKNHLRK